MTHTACNHEIKRLENEITRLRAANEELVEALNRIANTCDGFDECPVGPQTIAEIARAALSRAEQAKPETETCVWTDRGATCTKRDTTYCPFCGKRVEVKE